MSKSPKKIQAVRGMKDIMPAESGIWQKLEELARDIFKRFNYTEIRTPLVEELGLFTRSIGTETDIVQKEMYELKSRSDNQLALRPEATAGCVRAYLEHSIHKIEPFTKLYYIGAMFRAERPQAGRRRQFYQIGLEAIGSADPYVDAEVISLLMELLSEAGVKNATLHINSIGCALDKTKYQDLIKKSLGKHKSSLCPDCRKRLDKNALRVFDCKQEKCCKLIKELPIVTKSLCPGCKTHLDSVLKILDSIKVKYNLNPNIVRGLDYYTGIVFEVSHPDLGAQNAIAAGGRYDKLIKELGGIDIPACGFAIGMERLLNLVADKLKTGSLEPAGIYVATIGDKARAAGFKLVNKLRKKGKLCLFDYQAKSLKAQLRNANRANVEQVAIIGDDELKTKKVVLRNMITGKEEKISSEKL